MLFLYILGISFMKKFLQKYGAYPVAVAVFVTMAFLYCKPVLSGKVLQSSDDVNAISAVQETVRYNQATGKHTHWTESMFSGMPNYQIARQFRSDDILKPFSSVFHRGPSHPAWIFIFYFLCFFVLMRCFGVDKWLSIAGAIAVALSSYFIVIIGAGHGGKTISISYITLVAAGFYLIYRKKYVPGAIMVMLFTAIGLTIHLQMSYYLFMMIGLFFFAEVWIHFKEKRWKDFGIATLVFGASLLIGLGACSAGVFANMEYVKETTRGGPSEVAAAADGSKASSKGLDLDYATNESYGIDETFSLLIPGIKGGSSSVPLKDKSHTARMLNSLGETIVNNRVPMYWGDQPFTQGNVYVGAIICFLFLLGCIVVKGPYKWALTAATLLSILLSWGHNFSWLTELFFKYFPLYNKFRAVSSILIVAEIAMPLLGFLALKNIFEGNVSGRKLRISILVSAGVTAGICLVFGIFGRQFYDFSCQYDDMYVEQLSRAVVNAIVSDRQALLTSDSFRSFGFIVAGAALLWLYSRKKLPRAVTVIILGVLIVADMWPVDRRYFNDDYFVRRKSSQSVFKEQKWESDILADPDPHFRVMNMAVRTFGEARTSYRLESIGGYHAAKLRRYQDLIDKYLSQNNLNVIGMLNTKYIIASDDIVVENPNVAGNAWFVDKLMVMYRPMDELDALEYIDLSNTAVLGQEFMRFASDYEPGIGPGAEVHLTNFEPNRLEYDYTNSRPGTIVFSEIYYPYGWKAAIDGKKAEHYRVNYVLRALNVPAGSHHVTFVFDPDSVRLGEAIAIVCIILMYLAILAAAAFGVRKLIMKRKDASATS